MIHAGAADTRGACSQASAQKTWTNPPAPPPPRPAPRACGWFRALSHPGADPSVDSYRRLADVFHDLLSEQSLDALLVRIADTLDEIVPYEALHIYEADEPKRELVPALVRSEWADEILERALPVRRGHHRLGRRAPRARAREPGAPRPSRPLRSRHAARAGGADRRPARRARRAEGDAQRLPDRRGRLVQRGGVRARQAARRRGRARARQRPHPRAARARGADRLAHRPLQPPPLPRAPAPRADARVERARERRPS